MFISTHMITFFGGGGVWKKKSLKGLIVLFQFWKCIKKVTQYKWLGKEDVRYFLPPYGHSWSYFVSLYAAWSSAFFDKLELLCLVFLTDLHFRHPRTWIHWFWIDVCVFECLCVVHTVKALIFTRLKFSQLLQARCSHENVRLAKCFFFCL